MARDDLGAYPARRLACRVTQLVEGGDHVIVLGEVGRAATAAGPPLTYHARTFGTHAAVG